MAKHEQNSAVDKSNDSSQYPPGFKPRYFTEQRLYQLVLPAFSGPLDLLLFLIRKHKVEISDIPISEITQHYLDYLELMKELDVEIASEFLVATPDIAMEKLKSVGKITPLGNYVVIRECEDVSEENLDVKAIIFFGGAEQIRNLCMLAYFELNTAFGAIQMPWG